MLNFLRHIFYIKPKPQINTISKLRLMKKKNLNFLAENMVLSWIDDIKKKLLLSNFGKKCQMYEYRCEIVKVIDGDTVDVDIDLGFGVWLRKERIRLRGIDTPESRTRDVEEKKYGLLAKIFYKNYYTTII